MRDGSRVVWWQGKQRVPMDPVDALGEQLEEHAIEDIGKSGESHDEAVQSLTERQVFFLVTSNRKGRVTNRKVFSALPKIELTTSNKSFTFKIAGGMHLKFKAKLEFKNAKMWRTGTTAKDKEAMRLAYARSATFSSAVSATPSFGDYARITMSVEFAQILAKMYRELIPVMKYAAKWARGGTKAFLKMFPNAYEKLAWHLMANALSQCGHDMRLFAPMP